MIPKDLPHADAAIIFKSKLLKTATFLLGAEGQGIGEPLDNIIFVNPENRYFRISFENNEAIVLVILILVINSYFIIMVCMRAFIY